MSHRFCRVATMSLLFEKNKGQWNITFVFSISEWQKQNFFISDKRLIAKNIQHTSLAIRQKHFSKRQLSPSDLS